MLITLMLTFHIKLSNKRKKNLLTVFPRAILFLNVKKIFQF